MGLYSDLQFNSGEYIPQYVGAPLAEIEKTADTLAGRHYQNVNELSSVQLALQQAKSQLGEGMRPYLDEQASQIETTLQEMAKSGGENAGAKVNEMARRLKGDEKLMRMLEISKMRKEDMLTTQEMARKTGKQAIFKPEFYNFDKMTAEDPSIMKGYTPSGALKLDLNEAMASVVDRVKADTWTKIGLTNDKDIAAFKAGLKAGDPGAVGYLQKLVVQSNDPKLTALKDELQQAFSTTDAYKQHIDYGLSDEDKLKEALLNYTQLSKFTSEQIDEKADLEYAAANSRRANTPTPLYDFNKGPGIDVSQSTYKKTTEDVTTEEQALTNLKSQKYDDPVLQKEHNALIRQKENEVNMRKAQIKKIETEAEKGVDWNKEFNAWKAQLDPVFDKATIERVKTVQDFKNDIYNGSPDWAQGVPKIANPATKIKQALVNKIHAKREHGSLMLHYATNAQPINATEGTVTHSTQKLVTDSWRRSSTGYTIPVTGEQITQQSLQAEFGDDFMLSRKDDNMWVTDKIINGKPVMHLEVALVNKDDKSISYVPKTVVADNPEKVLQHMITIGEDMYANGANNVDRQLGFNMVAHAKVLPVLARNGFNIYNVSERQAIPGVDLGGNQIFIQPVTENGKTTYKLTSKDNLYFGDVGGEEQLAEKLFELQLKVEELVKNKK